MLDSNADFRRKMARAAAGDGVFSPLLYRVFLAAFFGVDLALLAHQYLLAVPPYRWLATAVVLGLSDNPLGALREHVAAQPTERGQVAGRLDLLGVVIMFVAVGVVVYAGFSIMSTTIELTDLTGDTNTSDSVNTPVDPLADHQDNFTDDYGPMFGFIALILLVAFLAVIIVYLQAARSSGFGGR